MFQRCNFLLYDRWSGSKNITSSNKDRSSWSIHIQSWNNGKEGWWDWWVAYHDSGIYDTHMCKQVIWSLSSFSDEKGLICDYSFSCSTSSLTLTSKYGCFDRCCSITVRIDFCCCLITHLPSPTQVKAFCSKEWIKSYDWSWLGAYHWGSDH